MSPITLRPLESSDLPDVAKLFDTTLGSGFWSLDAGSHEYCQLAAVDGVLTGAGAAATAAYLQPGNRYRGFKSPLSA